MAKLLIIDDDKLIVQTISNVLRRMGHQAFCAFTLADGMETARSQNIDLVFLDVHMPDGDGLEAMPRIQAAPSAPEVVIMTGFGDPDGAELAIRHGAWDYVQKPFTMEAMTLSVARALQYREEKQKKKNAAALESEGIIGSSQKMRACLDLISKVSSSDANVLITGETGTGKELFALAIHRNSPRALKNFVVVDCAALPEHLVESTLFGYEKGSYTGADKAQDGLILQADGGTLFLDEVGELPLSIQKSFLRVLQERKFRPVGGKQEISSNFRLIAATNRNLDEQLGQKQFREDLLFRLRSFQIELPPLRERKEDIKELVAHYLTEISLRYGIEPKEASPEFLDLLASYSWPGNVRELINALEKTLITARYGEILLPQHLPTHIRIKVARSSITPQGPAPVTEEQPLSAFPTLQELRDTVLEEAERNYLRDLLCFTSNDIQEACKVSGLSRSRLYLLLKKHGISRFSLS